MTIYYDIRIDDGEVDIYDWNGNLHDTKQIPSEGVVIPRDLLWYLQTQFDEQVDLGNTKIALQILAHAAFEDWEEGTPPQ